MLLPLAGCGGSSEEKTEAPGAEVQQASCVYAWVECGVGGARYPYAWPDSCASAGNTRTAAYQVCDAACSWQCIDTGDLGTEMSARVQDAR
ncbi:hypothetical protein LY474_18900 [Myxococcus stipitatus]|uniref:hypothetical protein n=1 Tax=Myxococcus stipitatus TaxID=83455 RepID=UPI001F2E93FD|nr:hypothetical protein [Myxococcus stipitatus]MCE9669870.1 hypothetical protein [Myxococcus stipitatus]